MRRILVCILAVAFAFGFSWAKGKKEKILAKGINGFVVTEKEFEPYREKYEKFLPPKMPKKEKMKILLRKFITAKLFAVQAEKLGLSNSTDVMKEAWIYRVHILNNYKIPDDVMKSYYLAHYWLYSYDNGTLMPFDKVRDDIRKRLVNNVKGRVVDLEAQRLWKEYQVKVLE